MKVVSDRLGCSSESITSALYNGRRSGHRQDATERIANVVPLLTRTRDEGEAVLAHYRAGGSTKAEDGCAIRVLSPEPAD